MGLVALLIKDRRGTPIFRLLREIIAPLDQQNPRPAVPQRIRQRASACACPDDDDVVIIAHVHAEITSGSIIS